MRGAVAVAGAVALALEPAPLETTAFIARLDSIVRQVDGDFAAQVEHLAQWVRLPPEDAVEPISRAGLDPDYEDPWPGISPFVVGSVLWAVYSYLRTPDDILETLFTAITVGGDVDTTAAMAGAIGGARVGLTRLPGVAQEVHDQGSWTYSELIDLAHCACSVAEQSSDAARY